MAKLRLFQYIENDNYKFVFTFDPDSISETDYQLVKKFGAQSINFGGTFNNGSGISFTLPDEYFNFPTQFPVTRIFNLTTPSQITTVAGLNYYGQAMTTKITDAITALRAMTDTFTGETVTNI